MNRNEWIRNTSIRNESNPDRTAPGVMGLLLALAAISTTGVISTILVVLAGIMGVTAVVGFCPLYRSLGITTSHLSDH